MPESKAENLEVKKGSPIIESLAEKNINPELLLKQRISEMQDGIAGFEQDGISRIDNANNSVGLTAEDVEKIKSEEGIDKQRVDNLGRAKAIANKLIAMGMAIMAFSGAGNFEKVKHSEMNGEGLVDEFLTEEEMQREIQEDKKNRSIKKPRFIKQEGGLSEQERRAIEEYEKAKDNLDKFNEKIAEEEKERKRNDDPKISAERVRNVFKFHIGSREYFDKLKIEFGGDAKKAKDQRERLKYLEKVKVDFAKMENMNGRFLGIPDDINTHIPPWLLKAWINFKLGINGVGGFYNPLEEKVTLPDYRNDGTAQHEFLHASTKANVGITEKAKKIFKNSYKKIGSKEDRYLSNPTEMLVRKQKLDILMVERGIKKYGEKFTEKHYEELMKLYNEKGTLSRDVRDFIKTTKPEDFKKIFNEIASNEDKKSNFVEQV